MIHSSGRQRTAFSSCKHTYNRINHRYLQRNWANKAIGASAPHLLPQAARTELAQPQTRDVSADIMEAAIVLSLKNRLKQYAAVEAAVECDTLGLLEGRFRSMSIEGRHWVTPLNMTAHKLQVDIGAMQVDYSRLLMERKISMKNIPSGSVRIRLSGKDMGNFVSHPLFQDAAQTAVQGEPFHWDKDSIVIRHNISGGEVLFSGVWGANQERYRVLMRPGRAAGSGKTQLQVGAQHVCRDSSSTDLRGAQLVAQGIAHFFTHMALDLQGIELRQPVLQLHPGDTSDSNEGDLLEISMKTRLRGFPPLNMQF